MHIAKTGFLPMVVTLLLATSTNVWAQTKPVLIVSISSIKDLDEDAYYLAGLVGREGAGGMVSGMLKGYTQGLDPARPLGIVVTTDGTDFHPLILAPVDDLDAFLKGLSPQMGEPNDAGDGILELAGPVPVFVKQQGTWAFASTKKEGLQDLPKDPVSLLGGLDGRYDLGIRAYMANIPANYREMFLSKVKEGIEMQLNAMGTPEDTAAQRESLQSQIRQYEVMLNEVDQLTIGIKIDSSKHRCYVDVTTKAVPGTPTARGFAMLKSASSAFTGFLIEGAAVSGNSSYEYPSEQASQMAGTISAVKPQLLKAIEKEDFLADNAKAKDALKRILDNLFAMAEETAKSGKTDSAMSVMMEEGEIPRLIMAGHVAGTDKLEATLQELADLAKEDTDIPKIQFDVDKHRGVRFHQLTIPITDLEARKVLGASEINLFLGLSKTAVCMSVGESNADSLKKAIDASAAAGKQPVEPAKFTVHVAPIVRTVASFMEQEDPDKAIGMRTAVEGIDGESDTVIGIGRAVKNGFAYRVELKEDVIRVIGAIVAVAQGQVVATVEP